MRKINQTKNGCCFCTFLLCFCDNKGDPLIHQGCRCLVCWFEEERGHKPRPLGVCTSSQSKNIKLSWNDLVPRVGSSCLLLTLMLRCLFLDRLRLPACLIQWALQSKVIHPHQTSSYGHIRSNEQTLDLLLNMTRMQIITLLRFVLFLSFQTKAIGGY